MQAGFGVKRPGQQLSTRTDDLTLVHGLFSGYSLPVHMVHVVTVKSLAHWKQMPCSSPLAPVAPVALERLPASYTSPLRTEGLSAGKAQLPYLRVFFSG